MRRCVIESIKRDVKMIIRVKQDNTVPNWGDFSQAAREAQLSRKCPKKNNGQMCPVVFKFLNFIV